jgi:hypothetical protein
VRRQPPGPPPAPTLGVSPGVRRAAAAAAVVVPVKGGVHGARHIQQDCEVEAGAAEVGDAGIKAHSQEEVRRAHTALLARTRAFFHAHCCTAAAGAGLRVQQRVWCQGHRVGGRKELGGARRCRGCALFPAISQG